MRTYIVAERQKDGLWALYTFTPQGNRRLLAYCGEETASEIMKAQRGE